MTQIGLNYVIHFGAITNMALIPDNITSSNNAIEFYVFIMNTGSSVEIKRREAHKQI